MKDLIWLSKEQENNIFDDGLNSNSSSSKNKLEVLNNKIYFYCNVNHVNNLHLNKELKNIIWNGAYWFQIDSKQGIYIFKAETI